MTYLSLRRYTGDVPMGKIHKWHCLKESLYYRVDFSSAFLICMKLLMENTNFIDSLDCVSYVMKVSV